MKTITIPYEYLQFIKRTLSALSLSDKDLFARRRFLRELNQHSSDLEMEQKELQIKYCEKDPKGDLKFINGQVTFKSPSERREFEKKQLSLLDQTFSINVTESNKKDIETVKNILNSEAEKKVAAKKEFNAVEFDYIANIQEFIAFLN